MTSSLTPMTVQTLAAYYPFLQENFPPDELKPLSMLRAQMERGGYDAWLLMGDGAPRGLALLLRAEGCPCALLDYLAMLDKGQGWGTRCLALLKEQYPGGLLVEAEAITPGLSRDTEALRRRRLRFYQRSGFLPCPFGAVVYGVTYLVHFWARDWPEDAAHACARAYDQLYRAQLPPEFLNAHVYIEGFCPAREEKKQ